MPDTFVFPGGAVDDTDRNDPELPAICTGLDDPTASRVLNVDHGGLAYWVAAIRECFEEPVCCWRTTTQAQSPWPTMTCKIGSRPTAGRSTEGNGAWPMS